jgi:predicted N-acetyltransferase YhbS
MFTIAPETAADVEAREALLDACFGPARHARACERLREGRLPAEGLAFVAHIADKLVGTLRFWHVMAGDRAALMLGPLAVDPNLRSLGLGKAMMRQGLDAAQAIGHEAIILVGDAPYYAPFGFARSLTDGLAMPGPVDPARFLGLEWRAGALAGATGMVRATGPLPLVLPEGRDGLRWAA